MQPAGARFGPYEIVAPLGAGGMGEVYRALDPRLGREVALKILPSGAASDAGKLRRFETEARSAAALNHPNVLGILDLGAHDGHPYVVSELLEGETFRDRLRVAPFPIKKAMDLAIQIACGLAAAHEKGIVHRDLKPDNLFLTRDGRAKILDFGLAKLVVQPGEAETATHAAAADDPVTQSGTVLGTVGYMSPEQVRGLPADQRSDIFSFGAVLYEMVTGARAFKRETAAETMTAILKDDPPDLLSKAPAAPPGLARILHRCLEKSPEERFHSARDVSYALETLSSGSPRDGQSEEPTMLEGRPAPARRSRMRAAAFAGGALLAAALAVFAWAAGSRKTGTDLAAYRFTPIATEAVYEGSPSWSPDGATLAYVRDVDGVVQVFTRGLAGAMAAQITQAPRDCREPFWSPDGSRIYYVSQAGGEESLWAVTAAGGTPQVVLKNVKTATLSPDGKTVAFLREDGPEGSYFQTLWTSSPPGAEPRKYAVAPYADTHAANGILHFSPDGSHLALWVVDTTGDIEFWLVPFPAGTPRLVDALGGQHKQYPYPFGWMPDGRSIVFGSDRLVRTPGLHLWTTDLERGTTRPLTATNGSETDPTVSPDGAKIAFTSQEEDYQLIEIPVDASGGYRNAHTASRVETDPAWSPRGGQYAFVTERTGSPEIWLRSQDGAFERPLVTGDSFKDGRGAAMFSGLAFSPDGQRLAYQKGNVTRFSVWISTVAAGPPVEIPTVNGSTYQDFPTWSPDGTWLAFTYMVKGRWGLAKVRAGAGEKPIVIKEGIVYPSSPRWSPRGDWITCDTPEGFSLVSPDGKSARVLSDETWLAHGFSRDGSRIYAVRQTDSLHMQLTSFDVATGNETIVTPDLGPTPPTSTPLRGFSLAPDGKSFLTAMVALRGDIWLLEGFQPTRGPLDALWPRASGALPNAR